MYLACTLKYLPIPVLTYDKDCAIDSEQVSSDHTGIYPLVFRLHWVNGQSRHILHGIVHLSDVKSIRATDEATVTVKPLELVYDSSLCCTA